MTESIVGGTRRTESSVCTKAYESLNPKTRYDPEDPETPLFELESYYQDGDKSKRYQIFSKNVLQKYLNVDDPFQLLTHNPDTKLTKEKLLQASDCIWKKYYAPLQDEYKQNTIEELRNKSSIKSSDNYNKYFDIQKGYVDYKSTKETFAKFVNYVLNSNNLDVTNNSISQECSSFMNPTDVFSPCTNNCIDPSRSNKNLTQPRLMQKELTKFDNILKDMYNHLMKNLEYTKFELKKELESSKVHPKRIKDILNDKFGTITHVPDENTKTRTDGFKEKINFAKMMNWELSPETQKIKNKRNKEVEKKRKQKNQTKLIKTIINNKGNLKSKYNGLFTLETPFDLTSKGKRVSKTTGVLKTKYGRDDKKIERHLRFKANQALKNTQNLINKKMKQGNTNPNDLKTLSNKASLLKKLVNMPHANKPLKLVRTETIEGTKTTVAKGGDKAMRKLISLFGIQEFKDKLDNMKQKYALTDKTEKILDFPENTYILRINNQKHPNVGDFKYFEFKELEKTVEKLFLVSLYRKMQYLNADEVFDIGELKKYEKFDIPYVKVYQLKFNDRIYMFESENGKFKLKSKKIGSKPVNSLTSLTYRMNSNGPFVDYNEAVRVARKRIRSEPGKLLQSNNLSRFYLRNEDRYRMEPIENILRVADLHKPASKSKDQKNSVANGPSDNWKAQSLDIENIENILQNINQNANSKRNANSMMANIMALAG